MTASIFISLAQLIRLNLRNSNGLSRASERHTKSTTARSRTRGAMRSMLILIPLLDFFQWKWWAKYDTRNDRNLGTQVHWWVYNFPQYMVLVFEPSYCNISSGKTDFQSLLWRKYDLSKTYSYWESVFPENIFLYSSILNSAAALGTSPQTEEEKWFPLRLMMKIPQMMMLCPAPYYANWGLWLFHSPNYFITEVFLLRWSFQIQPKKCYKIDFFSPYQIWKCSFLQIKSYHNEESKVFSAL